MSLMRSVIGLGVLGLAGAGLYHALGYSRRTGAPGNHVRDAGPEAMRDPPRHWDRVDETVDKSFPASDPPATY